MRVEIIKPGMYTTIQDSGRVGHQSYGVPIGGYLDRHAAHFANTLVGNDIHSPLIEATLIGPEMVFDTPCVIAITGGDFNARINDASIEHNSRLYVEKGHRLSMGNAITGCRAYIAIGGEWLVKKWLGSASAMSGPYSLLTPDSILRKSSILDINTLIPSMEVRVSQTHLNRKTKVHILPGPEYHMFDQQSLNHLFDTQIKISTQSNRIGIRLEKYLEKYELPNEMMSSGVVPGTIQLTHEGQPIILLADAQTTGGYPRIAKVIDEDLDALAQFKPGDMLELIWMHI